MFVLIVKKECLIFISSKTYQHITNTNIGQNKTLLPIYLILLCVDIRFQPIYCSFI